MVDDILAEQGNYLVAGALFFHHILIRTIDMNYFDLGFIDFFVCSLFIRF